MVIKLPLQKSKYSDNEVLVTFISFKWVKMECSNS